MSALVQWHVNSFSQQKAERFLEVGRILFRLRCLHRLVVKNSQMLTPANEQIVAIAKRLGVFMLRFAV